MVDDGRPPEIEPSASPTEPAAPDAAPPPQPAPVRAPAPPPQGYAPPGYGYAPPGYGYGPAVPPHWVAQVPPPQRRRSSGLVTLIIVLGLIFVGFILMSAATYFVGGGSSGPGPTLGLESIGVIEVQGIIRDGGEGGFFAGPAGARGVMKQIRAAAKDDDVKAVLLLIDSPGGSAAASAAIYEEIIRLRSKKKVVACMTDVAASGGYYIASGCDKIVAQGSTMTGSIGVIFGNMGYYGLMKKLGLTDETITAGKYKGMGRGSAPMTAEEKAIVVSMLSDIYEQFLKAVADGRKMDIAKVRKLAEGRIYTGAQAKQVGLIDELGNYYDAIKLTGQLAGIKGEPKLKQYGAPKGLLEELAGTEGRMQQLLRGPSQWTETPLSGPMLLLPYAYRMEPVLKIAE